MKWLVLGAFLGLLCLAQARNDMDARFIAAHSTKTAIFLSTSTTTTPFTCVFVANSAACQRRRYKRYTDINNMEMADNTPQVDGSLLEVDDRTKRDIADQERDARIALTLWTTTTSTFTITSTSINSSVTFSLSFFCTVSGANNPPACG